MWQLMTIVTDAIMKAVMDTGNGPTTAIGITSTKSIVGTGIIIVVIGDPGTTGTGMPGSIPTCTGMDIITGKMGTSCSDTATLIRVTVSFFQLADSRITV